MSDTVWLCVTVPDRRPILQAVYDNQPAAEAWIEGVEAGYTQGYTFEVGINEGAIDLSALVLEADHA